MSHNNERLDVQTGRHMCSIIQDALAKEPPMEEWAGGCKLVVTASCKNCADGIHFMKAGMNRIGSTQVHSKRVRGYFFFLPGAGTELS